MGNLASILKDEILRLARKEARKEVESLKQAVGRLRSEIIGLKARVGALEKGQVRLAKASASGGREEDTSEPTSKLRFSAARLAAMRKKKGLSAGELGALVGVSAQTIYHWESGKSRPRQDGLVGLAAVRSMGKRQIKERLAALEGLQPAPAE